MERDWRLFNVNNLKLARFKEIFPGAAGAPPAYQQRGHPVAPGAAKTDRLDSRKTLELFQLGDHLPLAKDVLQEVVAAPEENAVLKRLSRRRRRLVNERVCLLSAMQSDLRAVCPGLLEITGDAGNLWFLRFLTSVRGLGRLARRRPASLLKIPGVGVKYAAAIEEWQKRARFSHELEWVGDMIQEDAACILALNRRITALEAHMAEVAGRSTIARLVATIPGFGPVCAAELAGEIGTIKRFGGEASLGLYLGMANLDRSSGKTRGSKAPRHVNARTKAAMMTAVDRHRKNVTQSQRYYDKKRAEGKAHNQAVRALGRHMSRVIFRMLRDERPYHFQNQTKRV